MKIKILGTAACEGVPSVFCNCETCKQARLLKNKEIRTRSQVLIDNRLLIDYPADTYLHTLRYEIDMSAIKYMLFTHSHADHFYGKEFALRGLCYATNMTEQKTSLYMSGDVYKAFLEQIQESMTEEVMSSYCVNFVKPYDVFQTEDYEITVLPAEHSAPESMLYLIKANGKTFFHCCDTGVLYDEVIEYLKSNNIRIDCILMDCTMGKVRLGKGCGHMGYEDCVDLKNTLQKAGICDTNTKFLTTHFSHYGKMLHKDYEALSKDSGVIPAYDGMEIEL